jgi:hypothetical protein
MPWHMQPRLRDKEIVLESVGYQKTLNSQGVIALIAAEDAGLRPPKPFDLVTYWIGKLAITVSGGIPMNDFVPVISNLVNLASLTLGRCTYLRIGDWLQVMGSFSFALTIQTSGFQLDMSPPLAHTFSNFGDFLPTVSDFSDRTVTLSAPSGGAIVRLGVTNPLPITMTPGIVPFLYWVRIPA